MKNTLITLAIAIATLTTAEGQERYAQDYAGRIAQTELKEASLGLLAITAEGDTLADLNSGKLFLPASNMKLITTGLALDRLGGDFVFETGIGHSGTVRDGILEGDLYIIGGGDPTLASDDSIATPVEKLFATWHELVMRAGIKEIRGHVVGDDRHFGTMPEQQTWQYDDCGTYYGTGISGLSFFGNMQTFEVSAGPVPGAPVNIRPAYPRCPWMTYTWNCTTGAAGTGDKLYLYTTDLAPAAEMRGTFAVDRGSKKLECSNKFPAYTCASLFTDFLEGKGIICREGPADLNVFRGHLVPVSQDSLTLICQTPSPSLRRIAFETNHASDNLYAETLFNTLGKTVTGSAGYPSASQAVIRLMESHGITHPARITDGSGLSRQDWISPALMCDFLKMMLGSGAYRDFLNSLPTPGSNGTMTTVMQGHDSSITSRIHLKSGSMTGVKCFSGYILPDGEGGPTVFSIMINDSLLSQYRMQKIVDRILYLLSAE